jgi:hypothetical protein
MPVFKFLTAILAPGTTPPEELVTVPEIVAAAVWASDGLEPIKESTKIHI